MHTGFIDQHRDELFPVRSLGAETVCQAVLALLLHEQDVTVTDAFVKSQGAVIFRRVVQTLSGSSVCVILTNENKNRVCVIVSKEIRSDCRCKTA